MSLKGVLRGQKVFIKKLLEPHGFFVQAIKNHEVDNEVSTYDIIYDVEYITKWDEGKRERIETRTRSEIVNRSQVTRVLQEHYPGYEVEMDNVRELKSAKSSGVYRWRIVTLLRFWKLSEEDNEEE